MNYATAEDRRDAQQAVYKDVLQEAFKRALQAPIHLPALFSPPRSCAGHSWTRPVYSVLWDAIENETGCQERAIRILLDTPAGRELAEEVVAAWADRNAEAL